MKVVTAIVLIVVIYDLTLLMDFLGYYVIVCVYFMVLQTVTVTHVALFQTRNVILSLTDVNARCVNDQLLIL